MGFDLRAIAKFNSFLWCWSFRWISVGGSSVLCKDCNGKI